MTELLPCPFCGQQPALQKHYRFGLRYFCDFGPEHAVFIGGDDGSEDEARKAWNRRASPWRPMSEAPHGVVVLCVNAAGVVFTAVKTPGDWCDSSGQWRDPIAWMPIPGYTNEVSK